MLFRIAIFGLICGALAAQEQSDLFDKAPPVVDKALRARVALFYQLHSEGKFRAADALVAEESKDDFFAMEKTKYNGCEISRVNYKDEFKKAIVVTACKYTWTFNATRVPAVMPITSYWELVKGDWYWYQPPVDGAIDTPFGKMHFNDKDQPKSALPANPAAMAAGILTQVKADRNTVEFDPGKAGTAPVKIFNGMPGHVKVTLAFSAYGGLTASLDKTDLNANEAAVLTIGYEPRPGVTAVDRVAQVQVMPTGQVIPVKIHFQAGPAR